MRPLTNTLHWLLPAIYLLFFLAKTSAQTTPCAADQIHEQLKTADPGYLPRLQQDQEKLQQYLTNKNKGGKAAKMLTTDYTIPVVVHVIYTTSTATNNISDAQIESAIDRLNDIFSNATGTSVSTGIQFQLATMTESCTATTGIVRVSGAGVTNYSSHGIDDEVTDTDGVGASMTSIFNLSRWDPDLYMNVYIVSEIDNNGGGYGTQGYAFYPSASDSYYGIVMMYNTVGYDYNNCGCYQLKSYTDENETFAHEVGHYLNLKHTFEGGTSSTCPSTDDTAGDGVADTPAHKYITTCSSSGGNTCYASSHAYYSWEKIIHNYMGYWTEDCYDEFTDGQVERMVATLETSRPYLISSPGLQSTSVSMTAAACSPQTTTGIGGEYGVGPVLVTIGDMTASSGSAYDDGGYLQRPCFPTTLEVNQTYSFSVTTYGNYNEDLRIYIDWDNNGTLAESESVYSGTNAESFSGSFTVPLTATQGAYLRARVISDHYQYTISSSCYAPVYGQIEDYPVYVEPLSPALTSTVTTLTGFQTLTTKTSASQSFKISGSDLTSTVGLSLSGSSYELSSDGTTYASTLSFTPSNLVLSEKTIYARLKTGLTAGTHTATLTVSHTGATSKTVSLSGEVGEVSKLRGNALTFDGTGDYVQTTFNAISGSQSRSCEAWVKTTNTDAGILSFGSANNYKKWNFRTDTNGRLRIEIGDGYKTGTTVITDGAWHHVAVVLDNSSGTTLANATLYVDGMAESPYDTYNTTLTINTDVTSSMTFGKDLNDRYFAGEIDEVRIWTTARSATNLRSNMHLTLDGTETGLAAYYQFNESSGTTKDWVGGYNGSFNGNAAFTASGINCGKNGTSQTVSVSGTGTQAFSSADFSMNFTAKTGANDFTVTQQEFAPNSTSGASGRSFYTNPMWTLNQSSNLAFTANLTLSFDASTFTDLDGNNYSLYRRTMGSSGDWSQVVNGASAVTASSITFNGVTQTGQFIIVRDQITPEKVRGSAISLDGSGDYLSPGIALPGSYTKEAWVKYTNGSTANILSATSATNGHAFWITSGKLAAGHNGTWTYVQDASSFPTEEWVHVAVTYSVSGEMKLYKNGILVASATSVPAHGGVTCYVGRFATGYYFQGEMDEVRLWNTVRSAQEIRENMHLTLDGKQTGLSLYYQFNDAGSTVYSKYGTNDATLQGNASLVSSKINCGREGTSQSVSSIAAAGTQAFAQANLSLNFTAKSGTEDFTATYQEYEPNTTGGTSGVSLFDNPLWTLNRSTSTGSFTANATFTLPSGSLDADDEPTSYALYQRDMSEDGDWVLLKPMASAIGGGAITFDEISTTGQFMVVQTEQSSERGKALALDGDGDYLQTPLTFDPAAAAFTIEFWAKLDGETEDLQLLFDKTDDAASSAYLMMVWYGKLRVIFGNKVVGGGGVAFSYGEWHHVALTWDGTNCALYLDGKLGWLAEPGTVSASTSALDFGAFANARHYASGQIEEIRVWESARSQAEIVENMHLSASAKSSGAAVYYQLNNILKDVNGGNAITLGGNPSYAASGANIGEEGSSQSRLGVGEMGVLDFGEAQMSMELTAVSAQLDLTAAYCGFSPNTTAGAGATTLFDDQTWVLHETSGNAFTANLSFIFPTDSFSDLTASTYRLYHRSPGSDGDWALLVSGAAAVTASSVTFNGVGAEGQFMVGRE